MRYDDLQIGIPAASVRASLGALMKKDKPLTIRTEAASVLTEIRRALSAMVSQLPGEVRRPTDLQRTLGVDYKLCWQVFHIMRTDDPLSISQHVPGAAPTRKLLAAVRALGLPEEVPRDIETVMKDFREVVSKHSPDRQGFDSMVASISGGDAAEAIAIKHRRNSFQSDSQTWGTQIETHLRQLIVRKSGQNDRIDECMVNGKYGLRRFRQGVMPILHGYRSTSGSNVDDDEVQPLDVAASQQYGAPILAEFSSQPVPTFQTIRHGAGVFFSEVDTDQIGRKSTVNIVFSGIARNQPVAQGEDGSPCLLSGLVINTPTELAVMEMFVHRPSFGGTTPRFQLQAAGAGTEFPAIPGLGEQFVIYEQVVPLGSADSVSAVPEVPSYLHQMNHVFQKLGWDPAEFDVFRLRIAYPILHTRARVSCGVSEQ